MPSHIKNQLATVRRHRGLTASDLATRVGASRQTIYAIEAGSYIPNTELALGLARELEVSVEQLFSLTTETPATPDTITSEALSAQIRKGRSCSHLQGGAEMVQRAGQRRALLPS